ncbi:MAG: hypothetical protein JXL80_06485 [Planctomycetes bacterium]|nr:hypothetical protein [Planctomycetota bacterium]
MSQAGLFRWVNIITVLSVLTCILLIPTIGSLPVSPATRSLILSYGIPLALFAVAATGAAVGTILLVRAGLPTECILRCLIWDAVIMATPFALLFLVGFAAFSFRVFELPLGVIGFRCLCWFTGLALGHFAGWGVARWFAGHIIRTGK